MLLLGFGRRDRFRREKGGDYYFDYVVPVKVAIAVGGKKSPLDEDDGHCRDYLCRC